MNRILIAVVVLGLSCNAHAEGENDWRSWRGPDGTGVAPSGDPPAKWTDETIKWKVAIPGQGHSSPIVLGDRIFVMTAIKTDREVKPAEGEQPSGEAEESQDRGNREGRRRRGGRRGGRGAAKPTHVHEFAVMALDRSTGEVAWSKTVREEVPHEGTHGTNTFASGSPVTDGELLYAFFGSRGLYCLDLAGNIKWQKDFGDMRMRGTFGEGATPALHGDRIIVPWDHEGESFIVALDKKTGDQKWRVEREERSNWSMPIVVEVKGRKQVIHPGASASIAYDFETGDEIWRCKGMTDNVIPTPIIGHGMVYLISGFRRGALQAVQLDQAEGDITDSAAVAWSLDKGTPYIPSGLLSGGRLYFLEGSRAMLSCHDAKTGEAHYSRERLDLGGMYSSPVAAAGKIFLCDREGGVAVLKDGPELEVIATNDLGEPICATPAIVGGQIFVRGSDHLWCIGK